jgi:tRNA dimethylallyltransferase
VVRALEVVLATGIPLSRWQARHRFGERPYEALVLGLGRPLAELDGRIIARARAMVEGGFLDEVRRLRALAVEVDAVGYREMRACVDGRTDLETALSATIRATRRFAKRQRTGFAREPDVVWCHPERDAVAIHVGAAAFVAGATAGVATRA